MAIFIKRKSCDRKNLLQWRHHNRRHSPQAIKLPYAQSVFPGGIMGAKILLGCMLMALLVVGAEAATRCSTNSVGTTVCRDGQGTVWRGKTNSQGVTTWRDNKGTVTRGRTNSQGVTTWRDNKGTVTRSRTNSQGVTTLRDNKGTVIRGRTNSQGVTTWSDNKGGKTRCRQNSTGVIRCSGEPAATGALPYLR